MIGTCSPFRSWTAFLTLAMTCTGLTVLWGCSEKPFSVHSGDSSVSRSTEPLMSRHKPRAATTVGSVEEVDYVAMRLRVGHLWFFVDRKTEIEIDDCARCAFADIQRGDPVKIEHDRVTTPDGAYYAREIEIEHDDEDPEDDEAETEGVVENVDANRLLVKGLWFWMDGSTKLEADDECTDRAIVAGNRVKIEHSTVVTDGLGHYAYKIETECDCDEEEDDKEE